MTIAAAPFEPVGAAAGAPVRTAERGRASQRGWRLSAATVGGIAVVCDLANGFWITSLQGAIGAVDRASVDPVFRYLQAFVILLPVYVAAAWAALRLARRWAGRRRELARLSIAFGLAVVFSTLIGVGHATATAWWDYGDQAANIDAQHAGHTIIGACLGACAAKHATVMTHVRGISYAAIAMLVTNALLAGWVLALRGGRLWVRPRRTV